jgi:pentapeptide MXKDX repeat protein
MDPYNSENEEQKSKISLKILPTKTIPLNQHPDNWVIDQFTRRKHNIDGDLNSASWGPEQYDQMANQTDDRNEIIVAGADNRYRTLHSKTIHNKSPNKTSPNKISPTKTHKLKISGSEKGKYQTHVYSNALLKNNQLPDDSDNPDDPDDPIDQHNNPDSDDPMNREIRNYIDKECDFCKKLATIHTTIEKINQFVDESRQYEKQHNSEDFPDSSQDVVDAKLKSMSSHHYEINVTDTIAKNNASCVVYKIIPHFSSGGEASGIHFAVFRLPDGRIKYSVIKSFTPNYSDNERQILRTFKYSDLRSDPLIMRHYISFSTANQQHIVNEFIDGHTLEDILEYHPQRLSDLNKKNITINIYKAIRGLHKRGYLHFDIKPQNVMITENDLIKIIDFGKTVKLDLKEIEDSKPCCEEFVKSFVNRIFSTPIYISPNIIIDTEYEKITNTKELYYFGVLCDLWSFGMTVYEIYTGYSFFNRSINSMNKIINYMVKIIAKNPALDISGIAEHDGQDHDLDNIVKILRLCLVYRKFVRQDAVHQNAVHQDAVHQDAVHQDAVHQDAVHQDAVHQDAVHQDAVHQDADNQIISTIDTTIGIIDEIDRIINQMANTSVC